MGGLCDIRYTIYRLSSGGYYKYSSGGTPVFLFSLGYGQQGQDDLGDVHRFRWVAVLGTHGHCMQQRWLRFVEGLSVAVCNVASTSYAAF